MILFVPFPLVYFIMLPQSYCYTDGLHIFSWLHLGVSFWLLCLYIRSLLMCKTSFSHAVFWVFFIFHVLYPVYWVRISVSSCPVLLPSSPNPSSYVTARKRETYIKKFVHWILSNPFIEKEMIDYGIEKANNLPLTWSFKLHLSI